MIINHIPSKDEHPGPPFNHNVTGAFLSLLADYIKT